MIEKNTKYIEQKYIYIYYLLCMHAVFMGTTATTAVVVMRRWWVIDMTGWGTHRHVTSHDAGMIDTANVACTSDIWHACSTATAFQTTSLWQFNIILFILHWVIIYALNCIKLTSDVKFGVKCLVGVIYPSPR